VLALFSMLVTHSTCMISTFAVLGALGVRVKRVKDLDEGAVYVSDRRLLFLDDLMPDYEVSAVADRVFQSACRETPLDPSQ